MLSTFFDIDGRFDVVLFAHARIRSAHFEPLLELVDDVLRHLLLRRHFVVFVVPGNGEHEEAVTEIIKPECIAAVAALADAFVGVEEKTTAGFTRFFGVALIAVVCQRRANVFLEEFELFLGEIFLCQEGQRRSDQGKQEECSQ